ncbi:MAG: hypothetical protein CM15mV18_0250 [uncultured marine virus]|nr:MAG: hypothetical protein CM15mV18_0250 [uncultured marine virus]
MLKNIMTLYQPLRSTFRRLLYNVRTPLKQYASCVLVDIDDTLPSIFSSDIRWNVMLPKEQIGINAGRQYQLTYPKR